MRTYYGEANVRCAEPQGRSRTGYTPGETDIIIYQNGMQIAIQDALILAGMNKKRMDDHIAFAKKV